MGCAKEAGVMRNTALLALLLTACADHHVEPDAGPRTVELGECIGLAATLHDGGPPTAHVYLYDGQPCGNGGTCLRGVCE